MTGQELCDRSSISVMDVYLRHYRQNNSRTFPPSSSIVLRVNFNGNKDGRSVELTAHLLRLFTLYTQPAPWETFYFLKVKVNLSFYLLRHEAIKAHGEGERHAFLMQALKRGEKSTSCPDRFTPGKGPAVPIGQEATLATESIWAFFEKREISCPCPELNLIYLAIQPQLSDYIDRTNYPGPLINCMLRYAVSSVSIVICYRLDQRQFLGLGPNPCLSFLQTSSLCVQRCFTLHLRQTLHYNTYSEEAYRSYVPKFLQSLQTKVLIIS